MIFSAPTSSISARVNIREGKQRRADDEWVSKVDMVCFGVRANVNHTFVRWQVAAVCQSSKEFKELYERQARKFISIANFVVHYHS